MAGLVGYGSSDEENSHSEEALQPLASSSATISMNGISNRSSAHLSLALAPAPFVGPMLEPTTLPDRNFTGSTNDDEGSSPQSPYSANRALLRDLTLPTVPKYDIPPSPPGSPDASANSKFKHFLKLKRQGLHFNEKLARSSALKNPSLMQKLMGFSGISEAGQYSTTLSRNLWNPAAFPGHAYKDELAKSQQNVLRKREDAKTRSQRDALDFVPALGSGESSRAGTPSAIASAGTRTVTKSAIDKKRKRG